MFVAVVVVVVELIVVTVVVLAVVVVVVDVVGTHALHSTGHELRNVTTSTLSGESGCWERTQRLCLSTVHPTGSGLPLHTCVVVVVVALDVDVHCRHIFGHSCRTALASCGVGAVASVQSTASKFTQDASSAIPLQ